MEENKWSKNCCNPFKKKGHWVTKDLRKVTDWIVSLNYEMKPHMKICTSCRLQLGKENTSHLDNSTLEKEIPAEDLDIQGPSHVKEVEYVDPDAALSYLNACLTSLGEFPVSKKKQGSKKYCEQEMKKIKWAYKESLFTHEDDSEEEEHLIKQRITAALRRLTQNDSMKFMENFDPERSNRERRKLTRKIYTGGRKQSSVYDDKGVIMISEKDLCDCLDEQCPGCHFPCPKCRSCKCGHECRQNRKWMYDSIEIEGTDEVFRNKYR